QLLQMTAFALDGFAFSAEALVGGAVGARDPARLRRAAIVSSYWGVGFSVALALVFWWGGPALIDLMATAPEVRETARHYLIWVALAPLISVASFMFDGIYIGATWTRDMRIAMIQAVGIYVIALVIFVPALGNHGLWLALMVLNIARAATLAARYPRLEASVASAG
ncbi:MATE family efflux transporter, partial [Rhodobacteraceae bacterium R_SAG5]|nr:MATE family efflux transporter [Rhodobacteraceae bacterium R_SAG5]